MAAKAQPEQIRDVLSYSATQKQRQRSDMASTRFLYRRDDRMVKTFFETNVYKSAALLDLIYLFILEHGPDADVSQLLRDRIVDAEAGADKAEPHGAGSDGADDAAAESNAASVENAPAASPNTSSTDAAADDAEDTANAAANTTEKQPAQQPSQSGFDINDML